MPRKITNSKTKTHTAAAVRTRSSLRAQPAPPTVSGRWLLSAIAGVVAAAALCVWLVLCLLFWQGSWQLLYHPSSTIAKTPASAGLAFDNIGFAATGDGIPRLSGWWIPAASDSQYSRYTVLYLHGHDGNIGDTIPALAQLHQAGVNVFAFDYRGYGQSKFAHPSEAQWLQDTGWALDYLTGTRHIDPHAIVVYGMFLGANLALEVAAAHHELAGVVVGRPLKEPLAPIFGDARARLVPAHLLLRDRYDLDRAAKGLRIPALWFENDSPAAHNGFKSEPAAYREITSRKTLVWLVPSPHIESDRTAAFTRWLDDLAQSS
ncbi:MAG: alpha/beta hydrolase [Terracidiphilus sp.]